MADTRALVEDLYAAYARGDGARVSALLHDDIDWNIYAPANLFPFAGPRRGRTAVLETLKGIGEMFALVSYRPQNIVVDGDRAAVMSDATFTHRATGRAVNLRIANFLRWQDGRVIEFREFANTFDAAEQVLGRTLATA